MTTDTLNVALPRSNEEALARLHAAVASEAASVGEVFDGIQLTVHSCMDCHWKFRAAKTLADKEKWPPMDRVRWSSADTYGDFLNQYNLPR